MTIERLVLGGGGPQMFFTAMGAIKRVSECKDFELDNIKTIAGVSSGSLLAVVLLLGYDWIDL